MNSSTKTDDPPLYAIQVRANACHTWAFLSADGKRMIPVYSDRPIGDEATAMLRDAIRACKPVPTVLGRRKSPAPIPLHPAAARP